MSSNNSIEVIQTFHYSLIFIALSYCFFDSIGRVVSSRRIAIVKDCISFDKAIFYNKKVDILFVKGSL